jgi:hypothetical protein
MPSKSKSVKRYNLVNSRSLDRVHLFGGLPPCLVDFCWPMCRLLSTLLPSQSSSLTSVSDVHSVLIDRYDSVQLKIDGIWTECVPIDELIAASVVPCCIRTLEPTLRIFKGVWYDRSWHQPFYRTSSANYPDVVSQNPPFKRRRFQLESAETPGQPRTLRYGVHNRIDD